MFRDTKEMKAGAKLKPGGAAKGKAKTDHLSKDIEQHSRDTVEWKQATILPVGKHAPPNEKKIQKFVKELSEIDDDSAWPPIEVSMYKYICGWILLKRSPTQALCSSGVIFICGNVKILFSQPQCCYKIHL